MPEWIRVEKSASVTSVTLSRPALHNAFNDTMISELLDAFTAINADPRTRVVLLAAEGESFCAGADLNWMQSMLEYTYLENLDDAQLLGQALQAISRCPKPVIGRIQGAAYGGGVGLASVCDIVVAQESAMFALTEVKLGLIPAVISPFLLQKMPLAQARRYFLTAERFSAQEACRMGLVSKVVPTTDAMDAGIADWINRLCANGPEAMTLVKQLLQVVPSMSLDNAFEYTTHLIADKRVSAEGQEGMQAFLDKRPPGWAPRHNE